MRPQGDTTNNRLELCTAYFDLINQRDIPTIPSASIGTRNDPSCPGTNALMPFIGNCYRTGSIAAKSSARAFTSSVAPQCVKQDGQDSILSHMREFPSYKVIKRRQTRCQKEWMRRQESLSSREQPLTTVMQCGHPCCRHA